jgi:hypothetical protein
MAAPARKASLITDMVVVPGLTIPVTKDRKTIIVDITDNIWLGATLPRNGRGVFLEPVSKDLSNVFGAAGDWRWEGGPGRTLSEILDMLLGEGFLYVMKSGGDFHVQDVTDRELLQFLLKHPDGQ